MNVDFSAIALRQEIHQEVCATLGVCPECREGSLEDGEKMCADCFEASQGAWSDEPRSRHSHTKAGE
jgi:hypothetical protein